MPIARLILPLLLYFIPLVAVAGQEIRCKVVGVADGDTVTCLHQRQPITVRLLHIDAPERGQPYAQKAKQALAARVFKREVILRGVGYDRYQRYLAVVYSPRGENINLALVQQGLAWAYRRSQPLYRQAEQHARAAKIGLWQDNNPIEPAQWRTMRRSQR